MSQPLDFVFERGMPMSVPGYPVVYSTEEDSDKGVKVHCAVCGRDYKGDSPHQAYGCASSIDNGQISGGYGSVVADFTIFNIVQDFGVTQGDICDECILNLFDAGKIIHVKNELPEDSERPFNSKYYRQYLDSVKHEIEFYGN